MPRSEEAHGPQLLNAVPQEPVVCNERRHPKEGPAPQGGTRAPRRDPHPKERPAPQGGTRAPRRDPRPKEGPSPQGGTCNPRRDPRPTAREEPPHDDENTVCSRKPQGAQNQTQILKSEVWMPVSRGGS